MELRQEIAKLYCDENGWDYYTPTGKNMGNDFVDKVLAKVKTDPEIVAGLKLLEQFPHVLEGHNAIHCKNKADGRLQFDNSCRKCWLIKFPARPFIEEGK